MRQPRDDERHAIIGSTGSGKTVFGLWCLSQRSYDRMPWVIVDFKRDSNIAQIPRLEEIGVDSKVPKRKGLYVVRPWPDDVDDGAVTAFLRRIWERENCGVFIDEGYEIPARDPGLRALLTQGRSKSIPMICLTQRPAFVSPWLLSESEFKSVFFLNHPADIDRINQWSFAKVRPDHLPDHHSLWMQRDGRIVQPLKPCPPMAEILETFDSRKVKRWWF